MKATALKRYLAAVSLTGLVAMSLTGCFGEDESDADASASPTPQVAVGGGAAGGGGAGGGGTDTDTKGGDSDQEQGTDAEPAPEPEPQPAALAGAECIYGTWIADNNSALAGMRQYGDEIKSVAGTVVVEYSEDGTVTTDYQGWLITAQTEGVTVTIHRNGIDRGSFVATDSTLTMTDEHMGAVIEMDAGDFTMAVDAEPASYTDAPYTCSANELVINTPDGAGVLNR